MEPIRNLKREPGEGAVEYARSLVNGLTRKQATRVIKESLRTLPEIARVKECYYCGYPFLDRTRPGNAKVCGDKCRSAVKTQQKRVQRQHKWKPKKPRAYPYTFWLEYPYWISEYAMLSHVGSYERPRDPDKVAHMVAAKSRKEKHGRKSNSANPSTMK